MDPRKALLSPNSMRFAIVSILLGAVTAAAGQAVTLPTISSHPSKDAQPLDPRLASFSIEFSYMTSFGGNTTNPNLLTKELLQRLVERTGVGPDVRPGGITMYESIHGDLNDLYLLI